VDELDGDEDDPYSDGTHEKAVTIGGRRAGHMPLMSEAAVIYSQPNAALV
jgi:CDGSH-type Zn-finger protein